MQLQGVPYPQPYVIAAVGDQAALLSAIDRDPYLPGLPRPTPRPRRSRSAGTCSSHDRVAAPAYDGLLDLTYAEPLDS